MYLKEISATGFKSFADKITIALDGKTTCIVGPNGSGKSNIVDAVRWVLGEQSVKSLRGDSSMSDIIFSGSKNRKPLNVASVSLTFDNSDNYINMPYNEITVKRRVYRTGENEYFINNEKCRLKDVTELFLDSGIGKSSFNIISQGEVQKILSDSGYDRRSIFESAAGVLKYKKRKEEAIKKLEKTNNNLDRINDIISELELQIAPLKEQSEEATKYLNLKEKLKDVEVALIASEITKINELYQNSKEKQEKLNSEIMTLGINSNKSDAELINAKNDLAKIEEELKSSNQELLELTKEEERLNGEKKILKERSKYDASDVRVHENISFLNEEKLKSENKIYLNKKDIDDLNNEIEKLTKTLNQGMLNLDNNRNNLTSLFNELNNKKIELSDISHKIDITTDYINSGGAINSIKAVLSNPKLRGIHQILGNLISVDDKYVKAIDVALAASKQFIVVDDEQCAKEAIYYLKENKLGRATFFPISVIKPRGIDIDTTNVLMADKGYISLLSEKVDYDKKYYNIISNQLGNVILVDDIDSANRISKKINQRYRIVTLDGDIIHVGGTITGGSTNTSRSIFKDKQDLSRFKSKKSEILEIIDDINLSIQKCQNNLKSIEETTTSDQRNLVELKEKLNNKYDLSKTLNDEYINIKSELSTLSNLVDSSLSKEEERLMTEFYEASRKKEEVSKNIVNLQKEKSKINTMIETIETTNKANNSNLYSLEKELKNLEISINKMDIRLDNYLTTLSEDYELTYERAKNNFSLEVEEEEARQMVGEYKSEIKKIGMVNIQSIETYKNVSERYEFLSSQKNDLINAKDTLLEIITEMDEVMKEEFKSTFDRIQIEFENVFKKLFNGGHATLKLTDPKDLLETGIDIIASPPGKKLTSINLLSGGEKTLTAICLIFAILNIKTIPFCLFDEVEAALDEANVDNFGKYLDNYKDKTQFLIITHKKKTMEYANTLYGITMQESGVSKLVSVKLDNINK